MNAGRQGLAVLAAIVVMAGQLAGQERPGNRAFVTVGRSSLGYSCSVCGDFGIDAERVGAWGLGLGIVRPLNSRLALRFEGNVAKFPGEYLGTLTAGVEYLLLPAPRLFLDGGLGVYHQTLSDDCSFPAASLATSASGGCGWTQEFAPAIGLGIGTRWSHGSGPQPLIRLGWHRSLGSGFGSSNFPFHYNQVTLSVGVSVGM